MKKAWQAWRPSSLTRRICKTMGHFSRTQTALKVSRGKLHKNWRATSFRLQLQYLFRREEGWLKGREGGGSKENWRF